MMLEQFNVYRNCSAQTNKTLPYYMIVQNDYYDLATRVIIPLMRPQQLPRLASACRTKDKYRADGFLLCTPMSGNRKRIPPQDFVCNLSHARALSIQSIRLSRTADCREPAPTPERVSRREGLLHPFTILFHRLQAFDIAIPARVVFLRPAAAHLAFDHAFNHPLHPERHIRG